MHLPFDSKDSAPAGAPPSLDRARALLHQRFGFGSFRAGQEEIVAAILAGKDALAVMPTGGGKSLGYILPALLLPAPVLVVSPLIALMKDQVDALTKLSIPASFVNSTVPADEQRRRLARFRAGELRLLFIAPERFKSDRFREALAGFRPGLFAVDEAHCISEWGHDFRPDYLRLKDAARGLGRPPIVALTATATADVRAHIAENLGLEAPVVIVKGFERPNLEFKVARVTAKDEKVRLAVAIARRGRRGLLYAATRKNVEELARSLAANGIDAGHYHAGMSDADRRSVQERFASGALPIVAATNAFGMGIDRPDLRFVIHFDVPGSVEAYTQEAGRAGRDGQPAECQLLYSAQDARLQRFFIETAYPEAATIDGVLAALEDAGAGVAVEDDELARGFENVHARAVDSALRILSEHGCVARGFNGERRFATFVKRDPSPPIDFAHLRRRAAAEHARLQRMLDYAERGGCRRAFLVDYFAEGTSVPCGACDACKDGASRRALASDEAAIVKMMLDLVKCVDGRFGRRRLVGVLTGSRAKDILERGLDRLPHHGKLAHLSSALLDRVMNELVEVRLIEIEPGEYPLVHLTDDGWRALRGEVAPQLGCFDARPASSAPAVERAPRPASRAAPIATDADPRLVERLKDWRRVRARELGVPAYVVMHDTTITALAGARPRTDAELQRVKGIGPTKAEKFGREILEIVAGN